MANVKSVLLAPVRGIQRLNHRIGSFLAATYTKIPFTTQTYVPSALELGGSRFKWSRARSVESSIVETVVRWIQRNFTSTGLVLIETLPDLSEQYLTHYSDPFLDLLRKPNDAYTGITLWKATIADRILSGTSYWIKIPSDAGNIIQLWWAPERTMTPISTQPDIFIEYYEYRPGQGAPMMKIMPENVVRFAEGIDPDNPRKGCSAMRSLLKEIYTDEEAASMTAALLKNMGIPGVIIAPKPGGVVPKEAAGNVKLTWKEKFGGDNRGEPLVLEGPSDITTFGFNPQEMEMRAIRGIPEERITAVLGVNAAVVGLGAGLQTTKVGATLKEYRDEAFESTIIPMYREFAAELNLQLLPDFKTDLEMKTIEAAFDMSKLAVLLEGELQKAEGLNKQLTAGGILVSEYRRKLGYSVGPEHDVYLRNKNIVAVPAGTSPQQQKKDSQPPAPGPSTVQHITQTGGGDGSSGGNGNGSTPPKTEPTPATAPANHLTLNFGLPDIEVKTGGDVYNMEIISPTTVHTPEGQILVQVDNKAPDVVPPNVEVTVNPTAPIVNVTASKQEPPVVHVHTPQRAESSARLKFIRDENGLPMEIVKVTDEEDAELAKTNGNGYNGYNGHNGHNGQHKHSKGE